MIYKLIKVSSSDYIVIDLIKNIGFRDSFLLLIKKIITNEQER